jgi:hypothetical protein
MRFTTMALAGVALSFGTAAQAVDWRVAATNDTAVMFVDIDSVQSSSGYRRGSVTTVLMPDDSGERDWTRSVYVREVNCGAAQVRTISSAFYLDNGLLLEQSDELSDWGGIIEGSMLGAVTDTICGTAAIDAEPVSDPEEWAEEYFYYGY